MRAPALVGRGGWVNAPAGLTLAGLRGRIVLLEFWTSCCVNCLRVVDELRPLAAAHSDTVTVLGIHSPKFPREQEHAAVVAAVGRRRLPWPVLDDPDLRTWSEYTVKAWPTVVVIDPEGYVVGATSGEGCGPLLAATVERLESEHGARGTLVRGPGPSASDLGGPGLLAYPGKVAAAGDGIVVADTGHDRVLVAGLDGSVRWTVGGLSQPQGVRFLGDGSVVVCDTGADRVVRAWADSRVEVLATDLASPWDVVLGPDGDLVVAEAGRHRLWRVPVSGGGDPVLLAGTGAEALVDGPAPEAVLAQPSGLTRIPGATVFVDAESSSLRVLADSGEVATLVGKGLFQWGSSDGPAATARLQHPMGVAAAPDATSLYVADAFNGRLRFWSGVDGELVTLPVDGLDEPGGLDVLPDGRLVVADTNHHRVVVVDLAAGTVAPVPFSAA